MVLQSKSLQITKITMKTNGFVIKSLQITQITIQTNGLVIKPITNNINNNDAIVFEAHFLKPTEKYAIYIYIYVYI